MKLFKSLLGVLFLSVLMVGVASAAVTHTLSGSVIYIAIPGVTNTPLIENVNVNFYSEAACNGAKVLKEHGAFSAYASVTNGAKSGGDILKYVNLQCLPKN